MYLPTTPFGPPELTLSPSEYIQKIEDTTASEFMDSMKSPFTEWSVRDGYPELISLDKEGLSEALTKLGNSTSEIDALLKVFLDPNFNQRNRRGIDRLRIRISACRGIACRLWGKANQALETVPVGIALLPYMNAGAHPVPSGGNAILMNFGLVYLYDFFNLLLQQKQKPPKDSIDALSRLAKGIFGDKLNQREFVTAFPRSITISPDIALQSRIKLAMSCLYILLHEYGHIALGHTEELRKWPRLALLPKDQRHAYKSIMRKWEYEADKFAYDVFCGRHAEFGTPIPARGFVNMTVTDVFGIMGFASGIERREETLEDTHPVPRKRLFRLLEVQSDQDYLERFRTFKVDDSDDGKFVDEMLIPLLKATGAIDGSPS